MPDIQTLNIDLVAYKTKMETVGLFIHKLSNSLMNAEPNSKDEERLTTKINALGIDYNIYKDEIIKIEAQIKELEPPLKLESKSLYSNSIGHYQAYFTQEYPKATADNIYYSVSSKDEPYSGTSTAGNFYTFYDALNSNLKNKENLTKNIFNLAKGIK